MVEEVVKKEIRVKAKSLKTGGILDDQEQWWNFKKNTMMPDALAKKLREVNKGDELVLNISDAAEREYSDFGITAATSVGGADTDDFVSFKDLLKQAHEKFGEKLSITTEMIGTDLTKPVFKAQAGITEEVKGGTRIRAFTGHGDANIDNVTDMTKKHIIRMAETRAIARALRFALGEGATAMEEVDAPRISEEKIGE